MQEPSPREGTCCLRAGSAQQAVSSAIIQMYWGLGAIILQHQTQEPWGSKVLERLAADLKAAFPHIVHGRGPPGVSGVRRLRR